MVSPYGLATCCECGTVISNRDPNPCGRCEVVRFIAAHRARPTQLHVVSDPAGWDNRNFEMPDTPPVLEAVLAPLRRWFSERGAA